jgi:hypothetical protein
MPPIPAVGPHWPKGSPATAASNFIEAMDNDDRPAIEAIVMDNLAAPVSAEGKRLRALRLAGASGAIKEAAGGHAPPPLIDLLLPRESAREVLGEAAVEGRAMILEQALAYARQET